MGHRALTGSIGAPNIALHRISQRLKTQADENFHFIFCEGGANTISHQTFKLDSKTRAGKGGPGIHSA